MKFLSRGLGYQLFLTGNEAVLRMQKPPASDKDVREGSVLRLKMIGVNTAPRAEAQDELPGKVNYFKGNDPERWLSNIPTYARVNFKDVYPGYVHGDGPSTRASQQHRNDQNRSMMSDEILKNK